MTSTPVPPPAGWYPAPDGSSTTWWWDGARWVGPEQESSRPLAATKGIARLAAATQVLLIVCGVLSVATIGVEAFGISAITGFLTGNQSAIDLLDAYDQMTAVASVLGSVFLVVTGVVWVIWQYRVAKQVLGQTRRSPGWHVASWFVPIISFWFPYQNISDLLRAVGRARPSWQILWWLLWAVSNWLIQVSTRIYITAADLEQFRVAMWMSLAGELLLLAAAPLAWLTIRSITQGVLQPSQALSRSLAA
ncbi:DUF4328 domain-containing protein [Microbacterium jejuense]|uniref:DUF4328 domain-containing protein n=1 Tax=Microbacterium jejuense TaxID=1263637 RepID=A0ABS7HJB0_9MICO|nr:DUF4328 domain-containing protein [Microbacterium jejuense]MBW9092579.1 DUF4328 domain-containing protein [Microbacterium jejuense]